MTMVAERTGFGVVKWFSKNKGYGFITDPDGVEIFVHFSSINGRGYRTLEERCIDLAKEEGRD